MVEAQTSLHEERVEQLRHLTKTDADPRVRRRAAGRARTSAGRGGPLLWDGLTAYMPGRPLPGGRARWLGRPGTRRAPPKLDAAALAFLSAALEREPQAHGFPVTVWTLGDLQTLLLREQGVQLSVATLYWVVHTLGYSYGRPRHDLRHRQDTEAVAAAKRVLDWLQKNDC